MLAGEGNVGLVKLSHTELTIKCIICIHMKQFVCKEQSEYNT